MDIILEGVVGSTAYGLARPGSDIDLLGVYMAPNEDFLGLNPPNDKNSTAARNEPDVTYHELAKFCRLGLKVNPTITELLWLPDHKRITSAGAALVRNRSSFLSAKSVQGSYLGYATDQFKRIQRRESNDFSSDTKNRTAKHARHIMRLVTQGVGLWKTGELTVKVDNPQDYFDFGDAVQAGDLSGVEDLIAWAESEFTPDSCLLPDKPDTARINDLVIRIRSGFTGQ